MMLQQNKANSLGEFSPHQKNSRNLWGTRSRGSPFLVVPVGSNFSIDTRGAVNVNSIVRFTLL